MRRLFIFFAVLLALPLRAGAQESPDTLSRSVFFGLSDATLDASAVAVLDGLKADLAGLRVASVRIVGYSSPEGPAGVNVRLSEERARAVAAYLGPSLDFVDVVSCGGGAPWQEASRTAFPLLRRADVVVEVKHASGDGTEPLPALGGLPAVPAASGGGLPAVLSAAEAEPAGNVIAGVPAAGRRPSFVVYTNLAYDLALVPNIGTVLHFGSGWAVDMRVGYGWFSNDARHFYWRVYGTELAVRRYLRVPERGDLFTSLAGHHLGVYGQLFTYDIELGGRGRMGGEPGGNLFAGPQYGFGIEYGYTFRLAKHLNLDLSLGAGYAGGVYHDYDPFYDKYIWRSTSQCNWFGPARLDVTLQWLLGGAANSKKEAAR